MTFDLKEIEQNQIVLNQSKSVPALKEKDMNSIHWTGHFSTPWFLKQNCSQKYHRAAMHRNHFWQVFIFVLSQHKELKTVANRLSPLV